MNHEAYCEETIEDLFPRNFIYSLYPPSNYFGPNDVFPDIYEDEENEEEESMAAIVRPILDCENILPLSHKEEHKIEELPPSLCEAIRKFVIARAIRNLRGDSEQHCSMMINVSRYFSVQRDVADFVRCYIAELRKAARLYSQASEHASAHDEHMQSLKETLDEDYIATCEYDWGQIESILGQVLRDIRIFVANTRADEEVDYRAYEEEGLGLTAIVIGGLSLSRGLSLKGLCISYMSRNMRAYDPLMQMARWFGYRDDYKDLCRVYLSEESIHWYGCISRITEEMREQIDIMHLDGLTPERLGQSVRGHPDITPIIVENIMRISERGVGRGELLKVTTVSSRLLLKRPLPAHIPLLKLAWSTAPLSLTWCRALAYSQSKFSA